MSLQSRALGVQAPPPPPPPLQPHAPGLSLFFPDYFASYGPVTPLCFVLPVVSYRGILLALAPTLQLGLSDKLHGARLPLVHQRYPGPPSIY